MIAFRSIDDVIKARLPPHLNESVLKTMQAILKAHPAYAPEDDGLLILITPTDTDDSLGERLGDKWQEGGFEGVTFDPVSRVFSTMILRNNQFGISILIPDEPWLPTAIRERITSQM